MPRPPKWRMIGSWPGAIFFKPRAIPLSQLEINSLTMGEYEALRLADVEGLDQSSAAGRMGVSRATFGRILERAHGKVADALVTGKAIQIGGGNYRLDGIRVFRCADCGREWSAPFGGGRPDGCDACGSANFHRMPTEPSPTATGAPAPMTGAGRGRRRGRGWRGGRRP